MNAEHWRQNAHVHAALLLEDGQAVLARLLAAAGAETLDDLPPRQASALAWLAGWEADTVEAIVDALGGAR